jgi:hypothetical protein
LQDTFEQRCAVPETPVKAALGHPKVFGQNLDPNALDPGSRDLLYSGLDPDIASAIGHHWSADSDTVPYC